MRDLSICSYNLYGLNNGMSFLSELCNVNDIIFVQEHWLQPSQLHLLNNMNDNFVFYGKSSMDRNVCSGLLKSRPFGAVGVLWRKELAL